MTADVARWAAEASISLVPSRAANVEATMAGIPPRCGLYAIHAPIAVWEELGLGLPPDERPLYVGKSESSLAGRDIGTHFGYVTEKRKTSVTGYSTVRRSLAGLLREAHAYRGVPRNLERPGYFDKFGLLKPQDDVLSSWMRQRLQLAAWPKPQGCAVLLKLIETTILRKLLPPLNLDDVATRWKPQIDGGRKVLRAQARAWAQDRGLVQ